MRLVGERGGAAEAVPVPRFRFGPAGGQGGPLIVQRGLGRRKEGTLRVERLAARPRGRPLGIEADRLGGEITAFAREFVAPAGHLGEPALDLCDSGLPGINLATQLRQRDPELGHPGCRVAPRPGLAAHLGGHGRGLPLHLAKTGLQALRILAQAFPHGGQSGGFVIGGGRIRAHPGGPPAAPPPPRRW